MVHFKCSILICPLLLRIKSSFTIHQAKAVSHDAMLYNCFFSHIVFIRKFISVCLLILKIFFYVNISSIHLKYLHKLEIVGI